MINSEANKFNRIGSVVVYNEKDTVKYYIKKAAIIVGIADVGVNLCIFEEDGLVWKKRIQYGPGMPGSWEFTD